VPMARRRAIPSTFGSAFTGGVDGPHQSPFLAAPGLGLKPGRGCGG
jgi:hypothetical protein